MTRAEREAANDPASPCVDVCVMDASSGYCQGCGRTIDEIIAWRDYSADEKRAVLARLPERRAATHGR